MLGISPQRDGASIPSTPSLSGVGFGLQSTAVFKLKCNNQVRASRPSTCSLLPSSQSSQHMDSIALCLPGPSFLPSISTIGLPLDLAPEPSLAHILLSAMTLCHRMMPSNVKPNLSAATILGLFKLLACHWTRRICKSPWLTGSRRCFNRRQLATDWTKVRWNRGRTMTCPISTILFAVLALIRPVVPAKVSSATSKVSISSDPGIRLLTLPALRYMAKMTAAVSWRTTWSYQVL